MVTSSITANETTMANALAPGIDAVHDNLTTNTFSHNQVNQMVGRVVLNAPSTAFAYTPDGGLASYGDWEYAYEYDDFGRITSQTGRNEDR